MQKHPRALADLQARLTGLGTLAVPLVALCALTLTIREVQSERRETEGRLNRTVELHRNIQALQSDLLSAGTALEAYLLQGQEEVLAPFKAARDSLPERLGGLESLLKDDPAQVQQLKRVRLSVERYVEILSDLRKYSAIPGLSLANPPDDLVREQAGVTYQIQQLLRGLEAAEEQKTQLAYTAA